MARRRTLAPEFFSDEDISSLPFEARLLYAGLWCYADRDGRLEDRPKYLKAMIFPYDRVDVEKLLNLLASPQGLDRPTKVFIHRYVIDDRNYLEIPEFTKHQSPHHTEQHSRIPAFNGVLTARERLEVSKVQDAHYPISDPISDQRPETRAANTAKKKRPSKTTIPPDFTISEEVKTWAAKHGHTRLEERLEHFRDYALAKDYRNVDWDAAFRGAIRTDWAKLGPPVKDEPGEFDHLPRINNDNYWICGCPKAGTDVCRSPVHGMTLEESCQFNAQVQP